MKNHLAIFASGSGTNAEAILQYFKKTNTAEVSLIVTNKAEAGVIDVAKNYGIPFLIVNDKELNNPDFLLKELGKYRISWIILAGFLRMIPAFLVREFKNKMVNIHPALLPKFGGKGMYGKRVHEAVLQAGERKSGISIHYVTEIYDDGKIIFQAETNVDPGETVETLESKIHRLEHENYPVVIEKLVTV